MKIMDSIKEAGANSMSDMRKVIEVLTRKCQEVEMDLAKSMIKEILQETLELSSQRLQK